MKTFYSFIFIVLLFFPFLGCRSDSLNRNSVSGTVTLDDKPVDNGFITFKPEPDTKCPDIAGQIKKGTFNISKKDGPVAGTYTVAITASVPTGKKVKAPMTGKESDEMVQIIPAQYNGIMGKSVLTATIENGKNELEFKLQSKEK
jgi:hypothetical protein